MVSLLLLWLIHHSDIILDGSICLICKIIHICNRLLLLIISLRHLALPVAKPIKSLEVVLYLLVHPLVDAIGILSILTIELFPLHILLLEMLNQHPALSFNIKR